MPEDHHLRQSLRLPDLVSMQIILVVGVTWIGNAARQGPTHVSLWLLGIISFFLPVAAVVHFCARVWPLEGGVYQWTKLAIGPFAGFMSAWNFAAWAVLLVSSLGILTATSFSYALGPDAAWMASSTPFILALNAALFALILAVNITGLDIGRWVAHLGTGLTLMVIVLAVSLLFLHPHATAARPHTSPQPAFSWSLPAVTLVSVNLFTKLTFQGLTGLEQVAVFAGETRRPAQSILRSAWIAAPVIALIYILCTGSVLTYVPAGKVDLNGPLPQLLAVALGGGGWGGMLGSAATLALAMGTIAQYCVLVAEASRLPMVAAWDHLIPAIFTRLHPRFGTPVVSLMAICGVAVGFAIFASTGAGAAEAFQLISTAANLSYGLNYLLMFAVPLVAGTRLARQQGLQPGVLLRVACISGMVVTLAAVSFMLIPIVPVSNAFVFAGKLIAVAVLVNGLGAVIYWRGTRRAVSH
jgi:amino acid transporter